MRINQPAQPFVDLIEKVTSNIQGVTNLHGNVQELAAEPIVSRGTGWYYVQGNGYNPRDILVDAAVNDYVTSFVLSDGGIASFASAGERLPGTKILIYSGVSLPTAQDAGTHAVPLSITAPGAFISLYVDDTPVLRSTGSLATEILLTNRKSVIAFVLESSALYDVEVIVPGDVPTGQLPTPPAAPTWATSPVVFGFYGTQDRSASIRISWADSSFAGAWKIERTGYRLVSTVQAVSYDSTNGQYTLTIAGSHTLSGEVILDRATLVGPIVLVTANGGNTDLIVRSDVAQGSWVGVNVWVSDAQSVIANIEREDASPLDGVFRFLDAGVKESVPYGYRLLAVHPLHPTVTGTWSTKQVVFALDTVAPGPITNLSVTVDHTLLAARYTAPADIDYAGVRVYGPYTSAPASFDVAYRRHYEPGRVGSPDSATFPTTGFGYYYFAAIDTAGNEQVVANAVSYNHVDDQKAEVYISAEDGGTISEPAANTLLMQVNIDNDTARWQAWARVGAWPVLNSALVDITGVALTNVFAATSHGLNEGERVVLCALSGGSGLSSDTVYHVINAGADNFQLSTSYAGSAVDFTTDVTAGKVTRYDGMAENLDPLHSIGTWESTVNAVSFYAKTGAWYIVVRGHDNFSRPGPIDHRTFTIAGSPSGGQFLSELATTTYLVSGNTRGVRVKWTHTSDVNVYSRYKVHVYEAVDEGTESPITPGTPTAPTREARTDWDNGNTDFLHGSINGRTYTQCNPKVDLYCMLHTVYYRVELWDTTGGTLLGTYYTQVSIYETN
jgi:hypothetical protein